MQKDWIRLKQQPAIEAFASVVGKKEHDGPLGGMFDLHSDDDRFGMDTWEKAESEMQRLVFNTLLKKAKRKEDEIDVLFAGDLQNQCTGSSYGLLDFNIPYIGLYGACSTMAESLILSSLLVDAGIYNRAAAVSSSHYCSAERQFRFPLEYGGQRTPTSQWTATGAGAVLLSNIGDGPYVAEVLVGRSVDKGITDVNNMGAAMAPAVVDTLIRYFQSSGKQPDDFDLIVTGDLGATGHDIALEMMHAMGYNLSKNYNDCGLLLYSNTHQDTHSGGSGCGCSASVLCGHILNKFRSGALRDVLFIGTGALMSPGSLLQGLSIPGIAHLVRITQNRLG